MTVKKVIEIALNENGESWREVVHCNLNDIQLDEDEVNGLGDLLVWTDEFVYFPYRLDDIYWCVDSVPRNPPTNQ